MHEKGKTHTHEKIMQPNNRYRIQWS